MKTPCCRMELDELGRTPDGMPHPVMWNPLNGVVQCHACGEQYVPIGLFNAQHKLAKASAEQEKAIRDKASADRVKLEKAIKAIRLFADWCKTPERLPSDELIRAQHDALE